MSSRFCLIALAVSALAPTAFAQPSAPGAWEPTFAVPGVYLADVPFFGGAAEVRALARSGPITYAGGTFQLIDDLPTYNIARWDGTRWETLGGGLIEPDSPITTTAVEDLWTSASGDVYAVGTFEKAIQPDGSPLAAAGVARWTGDQWESLGGGLLFGGVSLGYAVTEYDGTLYVGGEFRAVVQPDGTLIDARGIARWTGAAWEAVGQFENNSGEAAVVHDLLLTASGDLIAAGLFDTVTNPNGSVAEVPGVARWDGTAWSSIGGGIELINGARALAAVEHDGALFIGGTFSSVVQTDGTSLLARGVARWDGTMWEPLGGGLLGWVWDFAEDGGDLLMAGLFERVIQSDGTSVPAEGLARWNGSAWEPEDLLRGGRLNIDGASALLSTPGGLIAGGSFQYVEPLSGAVLVTHGLARRGAAGWTPLSGIDPSGLGGREEPEVNALVMACGAVVAGGVFEVAGATTTDGLAHWNGISWTALPGLFNEFVPNYPARVNAIAPVGCSASGPALYAGGRFGGVVVGSDTLRTANVAYWDGAAWSPLGRGTGLAGVRALAADEAGVYVGGSFTEVYAADGTSIPAQGLARWTPTQGWTTVGGGFGVRHVLALAFDLNGGLVIGGNFDEVIQADGTVLPASGIVRWTGSQFERLGDFNGTLYALAAAPDGRLYVGGFFGQIAQIDGTTIPAQNVAVLDGQAWSPLGEGIETAVYALALDAAGRLYAGTYGEDFFNPERPGLERWDGSAWTPIPGLKANDEGPLVRALAFDEAGTLYVGGVFETAGGIGSPYLAAWTPDATTPAEDAPAVTEAFALNAYPNPFAGRATVRFALPTAAPVTLRAFDLLGRTIAVLADANFPAGTHDVAFDAGALPSGIYLLRLETPMRVETRKLVRVR